MKKCSADSTWSWPEATTFCGWIVELLFRLSTFVSVRKSRKGELILGVEMFGVVVGVWKSVLLVRFGVDLTGVD